MSDVEIIGLEKRARASEIFSSIQGEGMYLGAPSVFVRLFGCNLTCSGFSRTADPKSVVVGVDAGTGTVVTLDEQNRRVEKVTLEGVTSVDQLDGDSFTVGCDSRYSWDPAYKHLSVAHTPDTLWKEIRNKISQTVSHVVFTGGEPLMHQPFLAELIKRFDKLSMLRHITFETNATQPLSLDFSKALIHWASGEQRTILFSNSPKLAHSGEPDKKRINPVAFLAQSMVRASINKIQPGTVFQTAKYVIGTEEHMIEAKAMHYELASVDPAKVTWDKLLTLYPAMAMPLGADLDQYRSRAKQVAEWCVTHGFQFCPRQHLELYGNRIGT